MMRRKSPGQSAPSPAPTRARADVTPAAVATVAAVPRRPLRGRPPSAAARAKALMTAYTLLREHGFAAVTYDAVSLHSGVARTTLYRHWPDRAAMVVEAFFTATADQLAFPDTGSAREDFRQQIQAVAALLRGPVGRAIVAMVGAAHEEPTIMTALRKGWLLPRQRWGVARLTRAQADGECRADVNIPAALSALYGPLYTPLFLGIGAPSAEMVDAYLHVVGQGIFTPQR